MRLANYIFNRNRRDLVFLQGDHPAKLAAHDAIDRRHPVAGCQHPVIGRRRTAALKVAEHGAARFNFRALFNFHRQFFADSAQANLLRTILNNPFDSHLAAKRQGAFGHNDDAEAFTALDPVTDLADNHIHTKRNLRNQNRISAAGHACMQSDPTGIPSHHFQNHHPVMRFRSGMQTIQRPAGNPDRRVKTEGSFCAGDIIINGLGNTDDFHADFSQFQSYGVSTVSADHHQCLYVVPLQVFQNTVRHVAKNILAVLFHPIMKRIVPVGRAEDCSTARQNAGHILVTHGDHHILHQTLESVLNPLDSHAFAKSRPNHSTNYRIQARAISPAG